MNYLYLLFMLMLFVNCHGQKKDAAAITGANTSSPPPAFQMTGIPSVLISPEERAEYLVMHYWDKFNFADTAYIHWPEITEQAFVDYIDIWSFAPGPVVWASIKSMLKKAEQEQKVFLYFADLYEKYLYDPNSPIRNDDYYIPVLESLLESPAVEEKTRPAHLLELAGRNRTGQKATDFTYTLADGRKATLHSIRSDYTLLFFHNPDCHNCQEVATRLQASLTVQRLVEEEKLSILALYPDEDLQAWRNSLSHIPPAWINACDATARLKNDEIYDLKAIPTLYLLDRDKVVLLKDPTFERLEKYLRQEGAARSGQ
jgi:hypothetical protein